MQLRFLANKWINTKHDDVSTVWLSFEYDDVAEINKLDWLWKIVVGEFTYSFIVSEETKKPIAIETHTSMNKYAVWEIDLELSDVIACMIKVDIYIPDKLTWLIRTEEICL